MADIKVYGLDEQGVFADTGPVSGPVGSFAKAQNAVPSPPGDSGSIRKRPGLKSFSSAAGSGDVMGGCGIPFFLGSAGPSFVNPFTDQYVVIDSLTDNSANSSEFPDTVTPTFDDSGFWFNFDWHFDFDESSAFPVDDVWDIQVTGPLAEGVSESATASVVVPLNFIGDFSGNWILGLDDSFSERVANTTTYPNSKILLFPTIGVRADNGLNTYPMYDSWGATPSFKGDGYPTAQLNGVMYYVDGSVVGTDGVELRAYDGYVDNGVIALPLVAGSAGKAIVSVLPVNDVMYISSFDAGTTGAGGGTVRGSVYEFDPDTAFLSRLGAQFPAGHLPYSLLWAYGRLWCGTVVNQLNDTTAAKVYWIRPGIDTAWTLDKTFSNYEALCTSLVVFQGKIYATINTSRDTSTTATVYVRSTTGVWTASDTAVAGKVSISAISLANPTVVTTTTNHGLVSGQKVTITGSNSTPSIDNLPNVVTVLTPTTFSYVTNVTIAGNQGSFANQSTGGYTSMVVFPPENGPVTTPTPALFAVRHNCTPDLTNPDTTNGAIRKFNGSAWSTVKTFEAITSGAYSLDVSYAVIDATSVIAPLLWLTRGTGILLNSSDGTTWTDRTGNVGSYSDGIFTSLVIQV